MLNWFKNLFRSDSSKQCYPAPKTVFLIREYKALGITYTFEVKVSKFDSGYYIEHCINLFILREGGKLEPEDKYHRWLPKSGWTKEELVKLKMVDDSNKH